MPSAAIQRGIIVILGGALAENQHEVDAWDIKLMPMRIIDPARARRYNSPSRLGLLW